MNKKAILFVCSSLVFLITNNKVYAVGSETQQNPKQEISYRKKDETDNKTNGLIQDTTNKKWYFFKNGKIDKSFNGLVQNPANKRWFYVNNGEITWKHTGVVTHNNKKFLVENSQILWNYTGLYKDPNTKEWLYFNKSQQDLKFKSLVQNLPINRQWYYVQNGKIDWRYRGLATLYNDKKYFVDKGEVQWKYTGEVVVDNKRYNVKNGKILNVPQPNLKKKKVAVFGDSITEGLAPGKQFYENTWVKKFEELTKDNVVNFAKSGGNISSKKDIHGNYRDKDLRSQIIKADLKQFDEVIIAIGVNDYGFHSIDTVKTELRKRIKEIKAKNPNIKIYAVLPHDLFYLRNRVSDKESFNKSGLRTQGKLGGTLNDYINAIKEIYKEYNIPTLDWRDQAIIRETTHKNLLYDGVHPNEKTLAVIGEKIEQFVIKERLKNK